MIALMKKEDFVTVRDRFRAEKFAMNLGERDSTATITIGPEAPEIYLGDILRDEGEPGAGIYWRVTKVDTDYKTNTRTINCSHVISMLREKILFGEQTTATIAGKSGVKTCSAKVAMRYVMSFQRDFELGDFPAGYESVSNAYSFNGDDLFSAMETISETLEDCWWEYDLTKYPFKLHIRDRRQANVETTLRLTRNIQNAKLSVDRSQMYTRLFPIGKNDLQLDEKYVSRNENLYGMVCKTETNAEKETKSALKAWAQTQLKIHAEPAVTVTITAMDLSQQTGEPMDHIMLGAICQMPLPEYGTTILERINRMSWSDKIRDPNSVTVTLANTRTTATSIVASAIKSSSKSSRVSTTNTVKGILDIDLKQDKKDKNKFTLWKEDYKGVWTDVGTFSRAVTSWTVSVTDGAIKVTAKPQDQSKTVRIRDGGGEWSGQTYTGEIEYSSDDGANWKPTGVSYSADGSEIYTAGRTDGWDAARAEVDPPDANTSTAYMDFGVPGEGVGTSSSYRFTVSADNDYAYIKNAVNTIVAQVSNPAYSSGYSSGFTAGRTDGWDSARAEVDPPDENTSTAYMDFGVPGEGAGTTSSYRFTVSVDNNYAYIKNAVNTTVARVSHTLYSDGWQAARDKVDPPDENTSTAYMDFGVPGQGTGTTSSYRYTVTCGQNYAKIVNASGKTVAQLAQYYNKNGILYYDSYEQSGGSYTYYYHQTVTATSQAIVSRGNRTVYWHAT